MNFFSKIRKAITAGFATAAGAVVSSITTNGLPSGANEWVQLIGAALVVGALAGIAVWRIPNAGPAGPGKPGRFPGTPGPLDR